MPTLKLSQVRSPQQKSSQFRSPTKSFLSFSTTHTKPKSSSMLTLNPSDFLTAQKNKSTINTVIFGLHTKSSSNQSMNYNQIILDQHTKRKRKSTPRTKSKSTPIPHTNSLLILTPSLKSSQPRFPY